MKQWFCNLIIIISFSAQAQELLETPPGTIRINDSLYIDKGPVDNLMYSEFTEKVQEFWSLTLHDSLKSLELKDIDRSLLSKNLDPEQSQRIYEEITRVENMEVSDEIDIYTYFNHPEYYYHPVIGISREQARLFCQWRTDMVNLRWSTALKEGKKYNPKIIYRLPTNEEYRVAKEVFLKKDKLLVVNEKLPQKIDLELLRARDNFILHDISEYTATGVYSEEKADPQDNTYTFFRCICEVQE